MRREQLAGCPVVIELDVARGDMDSFGHVNNVVFFRYFEAARIEYRGRVGWFDLMRDTGVGPIVHGTNGRFRKPLTYPDRLAVGARAAAVGADRMTIEHRLVSRRWDGLAAEGRVVVVCFDYRAGTKADLPEGLRERIDRLEPGKGE